MKNEVVEKYPEIYSFVTQEEENYRTERIPLASNWRTWNMYEHIDRSFQLKNSKYYLGPEDFSRPFNNIILPIANVAYRTEGFDVKDVQIYVDNEDNYHKSFSARKFHDWWAVENKIDQAIDESVVSYWDYGLVLAKNVNEARPEIVQLQQIAFCDQTDIMAGPICLRHFYSIDQLLEMKGKWDKDSIEKAVRVARTSRKVNQADDDSVKTPGKYIEVFELHGMFPESWLGEEKLGANWEDTGKYVRQMHIITFYTSEIDGKTKNGITLFKGKSKQVFKALERDPIFGRACGRGGIEELFHPQIWTNYSEIHLQQMLEATSKVVLQTADKKIASNNKLSNIKQGQILKLDNPGETLTQVQIAPINKVAFDNFVNKWEQVARTIGSASDPQLGLNPTSGTPLGTTEIVTSQGQGTHEYHKGRLASFWAEIYRDWVIPHLASQINNGSKWLDELSLSELEKVAEGVANKQANERVKQLILSGQFPTPEEAEAIKAIAKEAFMQGGEKRFLEVKKGEYDSLPMDIKINIAGKQGNMAQTVSSLNSVFRAVFTPQGVQMLQQPGVGELFNEILEKSGLSPVNFSKFTTPVQMASMGQPQGQPQEPAELVNNQQ